MQVTLSPAVHRTILVADLEGFGDPRRTNMHKVVLRDGLYRALRRAVTAADIGWANCYQEGIGDGVLLLAPADVPKALFVERLPAALVAEIGEHNRVHRVEERIRLRLALHAGEIYFDQHGVTGSAITLAFRLLDAPSVKAAFRAAPGELAVVTSAWFFDEVVRNSPVDDSAGYRAVRVAVKETRTVGWIRICGPAGSAVA